MNIIFLCLNLSIILILYYPLLVNIPTRNQVISFIRKLTVRFEKTGKLQAS